MTFKDPWPAGVNQGAFDLDFTVKNVDASSKEDIVWKIDGEEFKVGVIIKNSGDNFANVTDTSAKGVNPTNLDSFVTVSNGVVVVSPTILTADLTYTLRLDSPAARSGFPISDQLPAGLGYVAGSFASQLTTWDADGLNQKTDPFTFAPTVTGNAFAGTVNVPGPSRLTTTYKARVTDIAALEAALQTEYNKLNGGAGNFQTTLVNTAKFGTHADRTASVRLRGTVAGPVPGNAFAKTAEWSTKNVTTAEDGALIPPAEMTYTLRANLAQWTGLSSIFTLDRNVVIYDSLPAQASWLTDPGFITATGITLTEAATCPTGANAAAISTAFADDANVGKYCVSGQLLLVNVGKSSGTNATITAKAQLNTVAGLTQAGSTSIKDATPYRWRNTASFYHQTNPYNVNSDATVVQLPQSGGGVNDTSVFTKTGTPEKDAIDPGQSVKVNYVLRVTAGKGIDLRTSKIVDHIDATVFPLPDVGAVDITGSYDGQALTASHFTLTKDAAGNLVIELSAAGKAIVETRGADKAFRVNLGLTTRAFDGKETLTLQNRATLFGSNDTPLYWSETATDATSFGDEAEVRKRVFDRSEQEWVETLKAQMDGAGNLVQDTYVFRIEFIPHGSYNNLVIIPVNDVLPAATEFLGFVSPADAATAANPSTATRDIGGNIEVVYDAASKTVTLRQKSGTLLKAGEPIAAYVAVRVTDASAPITNRIGLTSATIDPQRSVSVGDYVWVDTDRDGRQDPGEPGIPGVVLTVVGPDGQPVVDVEGKPVGPVTTGPNGEYTFDKLPALTGNQTYTVRIDRTASEEALRPYTPTQPGAGDRAGDSSTWEAFTEPGDLHEDGDRDPTLDFGFVKKSVSVGDYVWVDGNRDGRQDPGEPGIPGVVLTIVGPDGQPVVDVDGNPVGPKTTDANGGYSFDNLPVLTGDQTYTVRIDRTASEEALRPYVPTVPGAGDRSGDSSTWEASTEAGDLHEDGDRDPSLDFGFVSKTYAVGDVVWIDANSNGLQDGDEDPLAGVTVELIQNGAVIATTTTDDNGRYVFDELPAGTYQVKFTLTEEQQEQYEFTSRDAGADGFDSDADPSDGLTITFVLDDWNGALTTEYPCREIRATQGIDPTWDAGVVLNEVSPIDNDGDEDEGDEDELPVTGGAIGLGILAASAALLGVGGALRAIARRREDDPTSIG